MLSLPRRCDSHAGVTVSCCNTRPDAQCAERDEITVKPTSELLFMEAERARRRRYGTGIRC